MTLEKNSNFIQAYLRLNTDLVSSLIIKSSYAPDAINRRIVRDNPLHEVDRWNPSTWKYYMNLAGEYHPLDIPMYVASMDTRETILFSKETLFRHTATQEAYQMGTRNYLALLKTYPEQEALIRGILYPCDKEYAIQAEEGAILSYRPSLVEENERTLIIELEDYVKRMISRWYVSAYALTDSYYPSLLFANLSGLILIELLRLRVDRCKTEEVHSFHLYNYLSSHSDIGKYIPYLTREQTMYLYRNIRYIQRNVGSSAMFTELMKELLEKRRIPLMDYSVRQLQDQDANKYPILKTRRVALNKHQTSGLDPYISMEDYFQKEITILEGNRQAIEMKRTDMLHKFRTTNSSVTQVKDLESSMVDLTNTVPDPLEDVYVRQWTTMTHMGLYNVTVNFQDPFTTEERSLSQWDAIIYSAWLISKKQGYNWNILPPVLSVKYRRHPRPLVEELQSLIPKDFKYRHLFAIAEELVAAQPVLKECFSVSMFHEMTYKIYEECLNHWFLTAQASGAQERAIIEQMTYHLFSVAAWDFSRGEELESWRVRNNLPEYEYSNSQVDQLTTIIFEAATGYKVDETTQIRHIQKAMLDLFADLTSYSKQVIREISDGSILMMGSPEERIENVSLRSLTHIKIPTGERIWLTKAFGGDRFFLDEYGSHGRITVRESPYHKVPGPIVTEEDPIFLNDRIKKVSNLHDQSSVWVKTWSIDSVTGERVEDDLDALVDRPYEIIYALNKFNSQSL